MAIAKYIFTTDGGQVLITLDNSLLEFDNDESLSYKALSVQLFKDTINLFDFGEFFKSFKLENIASIDGVVPSDIDVAKDLLLGLIAVAEASIGGDASSANQIITNTKLDQLHADLIAPTPTGTNSIGQVTANAGTNLNTSALGLESTQALVKAKTDNLDVALSTRLKPSDTLTKVTTVDTITNPITANIGTTGGLATELTLANLGKSENTSATSGDTGVFVLGVRRDALVTSSSATGDYNEMAVDRYGSSIIKDQTRHKRTYSLAFTVAPATASTDIFQMIGSATTTVSITKINISGTQTTGGQTTVTISKRSTANTGGTSSASTMVVHDSADASATSVGSIYTANPTTGTPVGDLRIFSLPLGAVTATTNNIVQLDFGERGKPIVLNGVAQALVISLGGVTLTGGSINVWIEFTEE